MRCIFCSEERPASQEHIFPLAIGGTITTDRVCEPCNSTLGSRVDGALNNFLPIRVRRAELGLAGNSGEPPLMFEILTGEQTLVGEKANRIRTTWNRKTGKLDHKLHHHAEDIITADGKKARSVTIDARDKDQIPTIIQRERKRHGLPPLSEEMLAVEASKFTISTVDNLVIKTDISVSFAFLRHAVMKIAYELAFRWLGESYLDDQLAIELRQAILRNDLASTDSFIGYADWAEPCTAFQFWTPHRAHHLAYATVVADSVIVAARVFDIYAVAIFVSREAGRYVKNGADVAKLPFLAIDAASGKTIETTFGAERHRIACEMSKHGRTPPFPDPLIDDAP